MQKVVVDVDLIITDKKQYQFKHQHLLHIINKQTVTFNTNAIIYF